MLRGSVLLTIRDIIQSTWIMCALITNHIIASMLLNFSQICATLNHTIYGYHRNESESHLSQKLSDFSYKTKKNVVNSENSSIILFSVKHVED